MATALAKRIEPISFSFRFLPFLSMVSQERYSIQRKNTSPVLLFFQTKYLAKTNIGQNFFLIHSTEFPDKTNDQQQHYLATHSDNGYGHQRMFFLVHL